MYYQQILPDIFPLSTTKTRCPSSVKSSSALSIDGVIAVEINCETSSCSKDGGLQTNHNPFHEGEVKGGWKAKEILDFKQQLWRLGGYSFDLRLMSFGYIVEGGIYIYPLIFSLVMCIFVSFCCKRVQSISSTRIISE